MSTTTDTIKERLGIADVVGSYIKIENAGINFKARCPFHNEKTPSFFISPLRNTFYCFGCGAKGDIFEFVQRFEGLDFSGALKVLAERAGVALTFEKSDEKDEKKELFVILEEAANYYRSNLREHPEVLKYLTDRGLTAETIEKFGLGYAKASWRALSEYLVSRNMSPALIEKAGLIKMGPKGAYDRFRGRIMFPLFDSSGRVVAFSGRIFDESLEGEGSTPAKYVNSPETPLYHKSSLLYGFDKAKEGIRKWTFAIIVEGQMDLLMSHQAGFTNTVALSGTALTKEQLTLLSRLTERLVLSLDADTAGLTASGKSASLALREGIDVKVAHIVGGKDPADIVKESPEHWKEIIRGAKHVVEFYLDVLGERESDKRKFRMAVTSSVLPYVAEIKSSVDREHFLQVVAERLGVPRGALLEEMKNLPKDIVSSVKAEEKKQVGGTTFLTRKDMIASHLLGFLESRKESKEIDKEKVLLEVRGLLGDEVVDRFYGSLAVTEASFKADMMIDPRPGGEVLSELLSELRLEVKREKAKNIQQTIGEYESEGDKEALEGAMKEYQILSKDIAKLEDELKKTNHELPKT